VFHVFTFICFPSVSNFYFMSQYHQFPFSQAAAAAAAATAAAAAAPQPSPPPAVQNTKKVSKTNVNKTNK
jgi:hypothetical protein